MDKIEELIAEYGDPIYRKVIDRSDLTEDQIMFGDVAAEIAVFKIKHPSKVMIVGRHGRGWSCNYGERTAVVELLNELTRLRADVERLRGDGWISVKERLPEKNAGVTIYTPRGGVDTRALGMCDDDPNGLWYCCKGADEPLRFNEVTHWRPQPEPPRGENGENNEI